MKKSILLSLLCFLLGSIVLQAQKKVNLHDF